MGRKIGISIALNSLKIQRRFWSYVDVKGIDECWPWLGAKDEKHGYGEIKVTSYIKVTASRLALCLGLGRDIGDQFALHTCDNRGCCNPYHLYPGDHARNMKDMKERKRARTISRPGSKNPNSKLTEEDVAVIRGLIRDGLNNTQIAELFNVTHSQISAIKLKKSWAHLPEYPETN